MTLQEIKEKYAKLVEFDNWAQFVLISEKGELLMALNIISKEYAKAKLEEAAERAELKTTSFNYLDINNAPRQTQKFTVNKQSILETPLE